MTVAEPVSPGPLERAEGPGRAGRVPRREWVVRAVLLSWLAFWAAVRQPHGGTWNFFAQGSSYLLHSGPTGWTHLYADHPKLQIGPIAFLVSLPFAALPANAARYTAITLMTALGIPLFGALSSRIAPTTHRRLLKIALAGLAAAPTWVEVATRAGHLDDVLALAFGVAALSARLRGRHGTTALLCAAAADSKPWALAFAPLCLDIDRPIRDQLRPLLLLAGGLAVAWAPFLLGDPQTVRAARFTIRTSAGSALRALGVHAKRTPPWDRAAQVALGGLLAVLAMARGRPGAVLLVGICARLLLDPQTYPYYTAGLLVGAVAFDFLCTTSAVPVMSLAAIALVYVPQYALPGRIVHGYSGFRMSGDLRAGFCIVAVLAALLLPSLPAARRRYRT